MIKLTVACTLLVSAPSLAQEPEVPTLPTFITSDASAQTVDGWLKHIRPDREDLAFETIPWLTTLADGIRAADKQGKPMLLWIMNGHPLGCT